MCISFFFFQKVGRPHQLQLDSEFLWAKNLFRAVISLCLKHAFLKRSVPLNIAKAVINELMILNLLANINATVIPCSISIIASCMLLSTFLSK